MKRARLLSRGGEGRREDVALARQAGLLVLGYGATRVPTPAW
jgi:hypothetical protein